MFIEGRCPFTSVFLSAPRRCAVTSFQKSSQESLSLAVIPTFGEEEGSHRIERLSQTGTSYAEVGESSLVHCAGIIQISPIDHDWITQRVVQLCKVKLCELLPVVQNQESIGVLGGCIRIVDIMHPGRFRNDLLASCACGGIVGIHVASFAQQVLDDIDGGRFADVVCAAFECEPEHANLLTAEGPECGTNLLKKTLLLLFVDLLHLVQQGVVDSDLFCYMP